MKKCNSILLASAIAISVPTSAAYAGTRASGASKTSNAVSSMVMLEAVQKFPPGLIGKCFDPTFPGAEGIAKVCERKSGGT